jgi:hypothetical protein
VACTAQPLLGSRAPEVTWPGSARSGYKRISSVLAQTVPVGQEEVRGRRLELSDGPLNDLQGTLETELRQIDRRQACSAAAGVQRLTQVVSHANRALACAKLGLAGLSNRKTRYMTRRRTVIYSYLLVIKMYLSSLVILDHQNAIGNAKLKKGRVP